MLPAWTEKDGVKENIDPASLPLSENLVADLNAWAERWAATYDLENDPANPAFATREDEQLFAEDGDVLAARLRRELGPDWTVSVDIPA